MNTTTAEATGIPGRQSMGAWERVLSWSMRIVLVSLLIQAGRHPWPLLSRTLPSLLLFVGSAIYWGIVGRNSAPTMRSESDVSKWFHQVSLMLAFVLLFWPAPGLGGWLLPERYHFLVPLGVSFQVGCIGLAAWSRQHLGRNWSRAVRIGEGHQLVRTGPYRFLRHPIYTAMLGMFFGASIASSQYHALLGFGILLFLYLRKARLEEAILQQTFGKQYDEYRRGTWSLVPLIY